MKLHAIAFTQRGMDLGSRLADLTSLTRCVSGGLAQWTAEHWDDADALLYIGAAGIAVRAIAPHAAKKTTDPAVIVLDEAGKFAIPILSGHIGGANALSLQIARQCGATPVITTATDLRGIFAVDCWAVSQGLQIANPETIKQISGKLLAGQTVNLRSDLPITGQLPAGVFSGEPADMVISPMVQAGEALHLIPRNITLGIGCRKNICADAIEALYQKSGICPEAVLAVHTIDLKANEPGLLEFCRSHGFPLVCHSAGELSAVTGNFTASEFVRSVTGVDNVCERSALSGGGELILPKQAENGVTLAAAVQTIPLSFGGSL